MLTQNYGNISAQITIRKIAPGLNSGNLQVVIYDLSKEKVYFAYGYVSEDKKKTNAFQRPFIELNLRELFLHLNE